MVDATEKQKIIWEEPLMGPVELQVRHGKGASQTNLKLLESSVYVAQQAWAELVLSLWPLR